MEDTRLDELESRLLVGRKQELTAFLEVWNDSARSTKIVNLYGTAGIGKSFLLDEFQRQARAREGQCVTIDSDGFVKTPQAFCGHILDALRYDGSDRTDESQLPNACVQFLNKLASSQRILLQIDVYERMESMDQWLRDFFLKQLDPHILIVIAGRYPLTEPWYLSPAWRQLILRMPLTDLDYPSVERYAEYSHVSDRDSVERIWRYSSGHPLTMSLVTFILSQSGSKEAIPGDESTLPYLVNQWLREVPGDYMRPFVEAASVLRHFNQESLSFVMGREITASEFYQLIRFSFIRKADRGWTVHALMRDAIQRELLSRTPSVYEAIKSKALQYYYDRLVDTGSQSPNAREAVELMYYIGDALIRAFMNWFELSPRHFETAGVGYKEELEAYVRRRQETAKDTRIELFDPYTSRVFEFFISAAESRFTVQSLDFDALFGLGYDVVRTMRDAAGEMIGLAVIIPINSRTLPYLQQAPRSSAYFGSLPPDLHKRLSVPAYTRAGWFIETIDTVDFGDAAQQTAIGHLLHSLIFTGEFIVESPAPFPYFIEAHKSLGFETAHHGSHRNYDGVTETNTFVIDMQDERIVSYIHRMLKLTGQQSIIRQSDLLHDVPPAPEPDEDPILKRNDLTVREKEVAKLLEKGYTNVEIAASLYISEVTVKKHMKSMLGKLQATNRTQLLKKLLD
ncbi:LuxR C-terminal-related transcriptional regulator [Paenibacillus sp. NPDC056579]|uniref:helix-turn-helix transcriptional regulator n=1 Tax=Paenibacillus sp. NPDC056579 TaxID=3345871 RepID=UPI00369A47E7